MNSIDASYRQCEVEALKSLRGMLFKKQHLENHRVAEGQ